MHVMYVVLHLTTQLLCVTINWLKLAIDASYVMFAVLVSCAVALATIIRSVAGARGSRSMKSVWSVIYRLKALILDVRS